MPNSYKIKTALHAHPGFFRPSDPGLYLQKPYRVLIGLPSLRRIVETAFRKNVGLVALSSCHTPTSGIDTRFQEYMSDLRTLDKHFYIDTHFSEGWLYIARKIPAIKQLPYLVFFHSQEVRTDNSGKGNYADINVIGLGENLQPGQDIRETAKRAIDMGGMVLACHPNSRCGMSIEKAVEMYSEMQIDAIEGFNASVTEEENKQLANALRIRGFRGPAVSDSHHIHDMDRAYIEVEEDLWVNFSIQRLKATVRNRQYKNHEEQISRVSQFIYHGLPILLSYPEMKLRKPKEMTKSLSKAK